MPGKNLSKDEKKLLQLWKNPPTNAERPILRSIQISGEMGLRGINGLMLSFRYPVTAICGNNGAGKSTILALSVLAYHSPQGWFVHWGNPGTKRAGGDRTYYTFSDFFIQGKNEPKSIDLSITWRYFHKNRETNLNFNKKNRRSTAYKKRPEREVDFLPLARIIPAYEMSGVRSAFKNPRVTVNSVPLNEYSCQQLSFIMGKSYNQAETQESKNFTFQYCNSNTSYTAFNMGGGESCMIALLHLLQRMPRGGLLVIEEVESGLHPQAQKRLAETLIKISLKKNIQIICSTHSEIFLDALPRQARMVLKKSGGEHSVTESPSTRFAMYEMTGEYHPEIIIYCEDQFAATIISEALPEKLRLRVEIKEVGNNATVIRQGASHIRSGFKMKSLSVLDGDCKMSDIKGWIKSEGFTHDNMKPKYMLLPGDGLTPERWLLEQLHYSPYQDEFANQFSCSYSDALKYIEAMNVGLDHHDIGFILHQQTNLDKEDCIRRAIRSVAPRHPQLDELRERLKTLLD